MRSVHVWIGIALLNSFCAEIGASNEGAPYLLLNGKKAEDICRVKQNLCHHGRCISAPLEKEQFFCKCDECYGGTRCETNICAVHKQVSAVIPLQTYQQIGRILLVIAAAILGLGAIICLVRERYAWSAQKQRVRQNISADSSEISRVSTYLNYPDDSASFCGRIYASVHNRKADSAISSNTLAGVPSLTSINVVSMKPSSLQTEKPGRRKRIAWDEVEMRRHGLVDRFCNRPEDTEPQSIDVSVFEPQPLTLSNVSSGYSTATAERKIAEIGALRQENQKFSKFGRADQRVDFCKESMPLSLEDRERIRVLASTKDRIAVIIRRRTKFFTSLRDFRKPENVALIVFCPEQNRPQLHEHIGNCFDLFVFYNQNNNHFRNVDNYDDVRIPDKDAFGDELVEIVGDSSKIELLLTEETSIREICRLGERLGVKCVRQEEVMRLIKKELLLPPIEQYGIPTAKSILLDLSMPVGINALCEQVQFKIGTYPVFIRPTDMAECSGTTIVDNECDLKRWYRDNQGRKQICLVEEYLKGREFVATVCLLEDGTFVPLTVRYLEFGWSNVLYINTGHPLIIQIDTFENVERELPNLKRFVSRVIDALNPPRPHIFGVQGFQRTTGTDDYVFIEVSLRPAGGFHNAVCQKVSGVCQESALLMSQLHSGYRPVVTTSNSPNNEIYMSFPCREGILEKYTSLPRNRDVRSKITQKWLRPLHSPIDKATIISEEMLYLTLENNDHNRLLEDARWIANHWSPQLKPPPEACDRLLYLL